MVGRLIGLCPMCGVKATSGFMDTNIYPEQTFHCFCCGASTSFALTVLPPGTFRVPSERSLEDVARSLQTLLGMGESQEEIPIKEGELQGEEDCEDDLTEFDDFRDTVLDERLGIR